MKCYHLTLLRNGKYATVFCIALSIESFLSVEKEVGNETFILYSRELSEIEYGTARNNGL